MNLAGLGDLKDSEVEGLNPVVSPHK
jgi:hypothetical protein